MAEIQLYWVVTLYVIFGAFFQNYAQDVPVILTSYLGKDGNTADITREQWPSAWESGEGGISDSCLIELDNFSTATVLFMNCTLTNARPLQYCEKCVTEYISVQNSYNIITNDEDKSNETVGCKSEILRSDNIQVVLMTYEFVTSIWKKSNCDVCFERIPTVNGSFRYVPTNTTKTLLRKIKAVLLCFGNYSKNMLPVVHLKNETVCNMCKDLYCDANDLYQSVESQGNLCSDLIDSMNYTRKNWGNTYHCTVALPDEGEIWGLTALVCAMPVLLYVGVWAHANRARATSIRVAL